MIEGTVVGQSGMADAQLGPSIDMSSAERIAEGMWLTHRRAAPTRFEIPGARVQQSEEEILARRVHRDKWKQH